MLPCQAVVVSDRIPRERADQGRGRQSNALWSFPGSMLTCPRCSSLEFVPGQPCDQCGHSGTAPAPDPNSRCSVDAKGQSADSPANLAFGFARDSEPEELPRWRSELRKRVAEVQERKHRPDRPGPTGPRQVLLPTEPPPQRLLPAKIPEIRRSIIDPQPMTRPDPDIQRSLRKFHASIQSMQAERKSPPPVAVKASPLQRTLPATRDVRPPAHPELELPQTTGAPEDWITSKSILLTRTLSGLIDLLIVAGCTGLFVAISSYFGNIDVLSQAFFPVAVGAGLFFQVFYSLHFLVSVHRTAGMILTGLRVVDEQDGELQVRQAVMRTFCFLVSWLALTVGLLWGLWDHRSRCLHDSISHTKVVRC